MRSINSQIALLGVRIDNVTLDEAVTIIDSMIDRGGYHQIATANVDFLNKAMDDRELREILHDCELVLADGMPLVWASRLLGTSLKERVTGADLLPHLFELSARKRRRIFLLGATEERSRCALQRIQQDYPNAEICGRLSPPIAPLDQMANAEILKRIEEAKPDVLLVAFGNPKQEKWLAMHSHCLNVPVCIGVGASFDFFSRKQSRAPLWMQRLGMEWAFRLFSEPRRLGPRYLNNALFLLRYLSVQLMTTSAQPSSTTGMMVATTRKDGVSIVRIAGDFTGPALGELQESLEAELANGCSLIFDLTSSRTIWPDAAGFLARLTRKGMGDGVEVWLAGVQPGVRSVLRTTFPAGHAFRMAATVQDALRALHVNEDFSFHSSMLHSTSVGHRASSNMLPQNNLRAKKRGYNAWNKWILQRKVTNPTDQREAAAVD
jgi:N-acetylglucosaminyldiphosphoundecaprenol N-acetyl-beta-D-mannosaminyltransferase